MRIPAIRGNPAAALELRGKSGSLRSRCIELCGGRLKRLLGCFRSERDAGRKISREPKERAAIAAVAERGANPFKEIKRRLVLLGMDEMQINPFAAAVVSDFAQARENAMFDSFAEHAATQQKSIDVQRGPGELVDHNPD